MVLPGKTTNKKTEELNEVGIFVDPLQSLEDWEQINPHTPTNVKMKKIVALHASHPILVVSAIFITQRRLWVYPQSQSFPARTVSWSCYVWSGARTRCRIPRQVIASCVLLVVVGCKRRRRFYLCVLGYQKVLDCVSSFGDSFSVS